GRRWEVSRGSLLPAERRRRDPAPVAGAQERHPRARVSLYPEVCEGLREAGPGTSPRDTERPASPRLAGKRPRAGERDRAGRGPGGRPGPPDGRAPAGPERAEADGTAVRGIDSRGSLARDRARGDSPDPRDGRRKHVARGRGARNQHEE